MRKIILSAALAATVLGGAAYAAQELSEHSGPQRGGHMLKRADTNGDGTISQNEMRAHAEKRFARQDRNADGKLTGEELAGRGGKRWHRGAQGGMAGGPAMIDRMLDRIDTDKDGTITPAERQAAKTQFEARRTAMRDRMLKRVDRDGDGAVSKAEALAMADQRFARLDADRNGQVSAAEREALRNRWRGMRDTTRGDAPTASPEAPTGE